MGFVYNTPHRLKPRSEMGVGHPRTADRAPGSTGRKQGPQKVDQSRAASRRQHPTRPGASSVSFRERLGSHGSRPHQLLKGEVVWEGGGGREVFIVRGASGSLRNADVKCKIISIFWEN